MVTCSVFKVVLAITQFNTIDRKNPPPIQYSEWRRIFLAHLSGMAQLSL
jgi:hypothetical protein